MYVTRERREYSIKLFVLVLPHELAVAVVINVRFYYRLFNVCVVALKNTVRLAISTHRLHFLPAYSFQWFYKFFYEKMYIFWIFPLQRHSLVRFLLSFQFDRRTQRFSIIFSVFSKRLARKCYFQWTGGFFGRWVLCLAFFLFSICKNMYEARRKTTRIYVGLDSSLHNGNNHFGISAWCGSKYWLVLLHTGKSSLRVVRTFATRQKLIQRRRLEIKGNASWLKKEFWFILKWIWNFVDLLNSIKFCMHACKKILS